MPAFIRSHRRHLPTAFGILAAVVLAWYLLDSQLLVREMQREAVVHSRIVATLFAGLTDPSKDPNETLLEEWVRKSITTVRIPIPGTNKHIVCQTVLLALGGGCGITDPNLNEQPARARPPPDIPF